MTSIKPPSGRPPVPPGSEPGGTEATGASGAQFRDLVAETSGAAGVEPTAGASAADPVQALVSAVQAGELTAHQAVERLVERAVGQLGHHLSPAQREELMDVLREAVANDPALIELRQALGD